MYTSFKLKYLILSIGFSVFFSCDLKPQSNNIIIAPDGDDTNTGSVQKPIKSLNEAFKRAGELESINILLRAGEYFFELPIEINSQHAGKKITIGAYEGEKVILTGGVEIDNKSLTPYKNNIYTFMAPGEIKNKMDEISQLKSIGFSATMNPASMELFYNGSPLHLARFPNEKNPEISIDNVILSTPSKKSSFTFDKNRHLKWKNTKDIWVAGIFAYGWSYNNIKVETLDLKNNTITTNKGGYHGIYRTSDSTTDALKHARDFRKFYFYNVFEELDEANEWYFDKAKKQFYLIPPEFPFKHRLFLSVKDTPLLSIKDFDGILEIDNIHFTTTRGTALSIINSKNVSVNRCDFTNIGVYGVYTESLTNSAFNNCSFKNIGATAIHLNGGDRTTLTSSGNSIRECFFENSGRIHKVYQPAVRLLGVGHIVENCYIINSPGQAIIFSGNDHVIKNCLFENNGLIGNDIGIIYNTGNDPSATGTLIEDNFFIDNQNLNAQKSLLASIYLDEGSSGITVKNNFFRRSGSKTFGNIFTNGGFANTIVDNIFEECDNDIFQKNWSNKTIKAKFFDNKQNQKKFTETIDIKSSIYQKKYPHLINFLDYQQNEKNRNNTLSNNLPIDKKNTTNRQIQVQSSINGTSIEQKIEKLKSLNKL